jgi:ankyrin repeat protein
LRRDGRTALHLAAGQNHVKVTKVLLENGADVNAKSK